MIKTSTLFSLKGGFFTLTSLQILHSDLSELADQLEAKVKQAPNFFRHAPIVLDVHKLNREQQAELDLNKLKLILKSLQLVPVGLQGAQSELQNKAMLEGFALISESRQEAKSQTQAPTISVHTEQPFAGSPTKIITQPIRSGQQVYAPHGDLLVLAPVSPGAELLADGHIHVMGPLRGRALAGMNGDQNAMIFCKSLEAELVSIAGQYQISEGLKTLWKQPARIELVAGRLNIVDF